MSVFRNLMTGIFVLAAAQASAAENERPYLLQFTDEVASTAGIGLLKDTPIPDRSSEIRVWIGFGILEPEHMLRLRLDSAGNVSGEVLVHFHSDTSQPKSHDDVIFQNQVMRSCTNLRQGKELGVCTATFKHTPSWKALYKELVRLGIQTLPDESDLPKPKTNVSDGIAMVVEVKEGPSYRAYEYSNPNFRHEPEAKAASQILRTISQVFPQLGGT